MMSHWLFGCAKTAARGGAARRLDRIITSIYSVNAALGKTYFFKIGGGDL